MVKFGLAQVVNFRLSFLGGKKCYYIARFKDSSGAFTLDSSFGTNGVVSTSYNTGDMFLTNILLSGDKVYAIGKMTNRDSIALSRYDNDGAFDLTFSGDGKRVVTYESITGVRPFDLVANAAGNVFICGVAKINAGGRSKIFTTCITKTGAVYEPFGQNTHQLEKGVVLYDQFENPSNGTEQSYMGLGIALSDDGSLAISGACDEQG